MRLLYFNCGNFCEINFFFNYGTKKKSGALIYLFNGNFLHIRKIKAKKIFSTYSPVILITIKIKRLIYENLKKILYSDSLNEISLFELFAYQSTSENGKVI